MRIDIIRFILGLGISVGHMYLCFKLTIGKADLPTVVIKQSQNSNHGSAIDDLIHESCKTDLLTYFSIKKIKPSCLSYTFNIAR